MHMHMHVCVYICAVTVIALILDSKKILSVYYIRDSVHM